jgi:hypothetical protein
VAGKYNAYGALLHSFQFFRQIAGYLVIPRLTIIFQNGISAKYMLVRSAGEHHRGIIPEDRITFWRP